MPWTQYLLSGKMNPYRTHLVLANVGKFFTRMNSLNLDTLPLLLSRWGNLHRKFQSNWKKSQELFLIPNLLYLISFLISLILSHKYLSYIFPPLICRAADLYRTTLNTFLQVYFLKYYWLLFNKNRTLKKIHFENSHLWKIKLLLEGF